MFETKEELQAKITELETKLDSLEFRVDSLLINRECISKDRDNLRKSLSESNKKVEELDYNYKRVDKRATELWADNYAINQLNTALRGNLDILKEVYELREAKIRAQEDMIKILSEPKWSNKHCPTCLHYHECSHTQDECIRRGVENAEKEKLAEKRPAKTTTHA